MKSIPPFQFLDDAELRSVAANASLQYYPKGSTILQQDGPPSEFLRIIRKGGVKVFIQPHQDEEVIIDYRSDGDSFGLLSLVGGDKSRANVVAVEGTTCYLVGKAVVVKLIDGNPTFIEYFLKSFLNKFIDKTYREMHNRSLLYGGGDKLLFSTPVGEIAVKDVSTASQGISIREAAELMSLKRNSSLVIVDKHGVPTGIVTDRDFRDKVVARGRMVTDSIESIMSVSLIKAEVRDYCFDALLKMIRYDVHHLLVVDEGRLRGILTNHDLMMLQGTSPILMAREIECLQTIDDLGPLSAKLGKIVGLLLREGLRAGNMLRIITEINDRILRRVIEITEKMMGRPPVSYCWLVFGSEGRKEQTFRTDQDNAIVYADPLIEGEGEARNYFLQFADSVINSLKKIGFAPCASNCVANNPQWCQPLRDWKRNFSAWIYTPNADAVRKSIIFFDFRPVHGDATLAGTLRESLRTMLEGQMVFLGFMANMIIRTAPPVGFFRSHIVEKSGERREIFSLKVKGLTPIVDIVRLFSLEKGVKETSTLERIASLSEKHTILKEYAEELEHAFEFIMLLRVQHQFEQIESGSSPDDFIDPNKLSNLERKTMKEVFRLIAKLQDIIIERYKPLIW